MLFDHDSLIFSGQKRKIEKKTWKWNCLNRCSNLDRKLCSSTEALENATLNGQQFSTMLGKIALLMNEWLGNAKYICNYVLVVQAHRYRHVLKNCVRFLRVARRRLKRIKVYRRRFSFLLKGLTKRRYETQRHFFVWSIFNSTCARCLWIDERHQSQQTSRRNHADNTTESTVNGNVTGGQKQKF